MKVTTFQARDMREALKEVKEKLGADAVILSTRSIREPGTGLSSGRTLIEVTACPSPNATDVQPLSTVASDTAPEAMLNKEGRASSSPHLFARVVDDPIEYPSIESQEPLRSRGRGYGGSTESGGRPNKTLLTESHPLASESNALISLAETPAMGAGLDVEGKRQYSWLLMHGVEEPIARKLALMGGVGKEQSLAIAFQRALKFHDPLQGDNRVIALVGPTGVGKTTTLAKIAADLILNRQRSVGMITLDTFRVGAVAQLETYAKLLQVRLVVARSLSEVKAGLHSLNRCDYVLVDTVGSSPYNSRQVNTTAGLLPVMGDNREVILCMAANVREAEQLAIYRRFAILEPTGLIFTKLDETVTYGGILNVCVKANLPLTLYTDGQRVPENLGWMSPDALARWFEQGAPQEI